MALATPDDAVREYAYNIGADCADRAWLCTSYDSWIANPHYVGPEMPHPEDDDAHEDIAAWRAARVETRARQAAQRAAAPAVAADRDGDIPF